ncbi:MAG: ATP synthase F1 subunit gamma [Clostridiales Family XIII bacterium]|jgi:F-type H+-transporting ATPase subunit gamma|nr:ATP synthase F1 subunit gamma [Clostridiales Family XIII bacterium]
MQGIKRRIRSITSIEHITSAMKLVSSAKLRRARNIFERVQDNLRFVTDTIDDILVSVSDVPDAYILGSREIKRTCYVVVTSNRGLAGSFNANIIKEAERLIAKANAPEKPLIVCIGSKGRDYFRKREHEILSEYLLAPEDVTFEEMSLITKEIVGLYDEGVIDELVFVYTAFISTMEQRAVSERLLPFEKKTADTEKSPRQLEHPVDYEPGPEAVFAYLVPKYAEIMLYRTVIESAICEHAARRMAMQNATDSARDMMTSLNLFYNRARQAAITNEITEIVSGAEQVR